MCEFTSSFHQRKEKMNDNNKLLDEEFGDRSGFFKLLKFFQYNPQIRVLHAIKY